MSAVRMLTVSNGWRSSSAAIWAKVVLVPVMSLEPVTIPKVPSSLSFTIALAGWRPLSQPPAAKPTPRRLP